MTRLPVLLTILLVIATPVAIWFDATGNPLYYLNTAVPPGQFLYVLSKLAGLLALTLFWLQAMAALARGTPALQGFPRLSTVAHRRLGLAVFMLVLTHALLFAAAVSLRSGHIAWALFVPDLAGSYYGFYISLGVIAFFLFPIGVVAGLRRARGAVWQWLHRIWAVVFSLAFLHAAVVGTETRYGLMLYVYVFIGVSLSAALLLRLLTAHRHRRASVASSSATGSNAGRQWPRRIQ